MEGDGGRASRPGSMRGPLTPRGSNGHSVDGESGFTARRESNVYKDILAEMEGGARGELPTLHEQIEAVRALTAFVLFVVSEAMGVTVPNVVWDKVKDGDTFGPTVEGPGSASFRAIVVGAPLLGNIVGSVLGGVVADAYGRHAAIAVHSTLFTGASLWSAMSVDKSSFVMSRFVLGISLGIITPVLVSFMAELAPVAKRARAVVIIPGFGFPCGQILMLMTGLLLQSYLPNVPETGAAGDASAQLHKGLEAQLPTGLEWWRWLMVAGIVPNVVALVLVRHYVPESPHFLLGVGETEKAERVLRTIAQVNKTEALLLRGGRVRPSQGSPDREDRGEGGKWETKLARTKRLGLELLSPPLHQHMLRLLGMWMLAGLGQFGTDTILPSLLEKQHLDMSARLRTLLVITILAWPSFFIAIRLLGTNFQKTWPQLSSRRAVLVVMAGLAGVLTLLAGVLVSEGLLLLILACVLVKMASHATMQTIDLYSAEVLPTSHRATGIALANGASKLVGVLAAFYALSSYFGGRMETTQHYFAFSAAFSAAAVVAWLSPDVGGDGQLIVDYQELQLTHRGAGNQHVQHNDNLHVYLVSSGGAGQSDEKEVGGVGGVPSYGAIPKGQNEPFGMT